MMKRQDEPTPGFLTFWGAYPRKVARLDALHAWIKNNCESLTTEILESVADHRKWHQWRDADGAYIPHAATFLNGHRWEDARLFATDEEQAADDIAYFERVRAESIEQGARVVSRLRGIVGGKA